MSIIKSIYDNKSIRYLISGCIAFVAEYTSFIIIYYTAIQSGVVANIISFTFGLVTSFTLNKYFTFRDNNQQRKGSLQIILYIALAISNLLMTTVAIGFLLSLHIKAFVAKILLMMLVAVWNYFLFKKFIFK